MAGRRLELVGALGAALLLAACSSSPPVRYPTPDPAAPMGVAYDAGTGQATFRVWAPAAIAFVHGGCEMGRTKRVGSQMAETTYGNVPGVYYVTNSYDSSDGVNGYDWASWTAPGSEGEKTWRYLQGLLALRRSSDAFRLGDKALAAASVTLIDGLQQFAIAYRVVSSAGTERFHVFVNASRSATNLATGSDLTAATVVVDDDEAGAGPVGAPSGYTLTTTSIAVAPRTAVIFRTAN